MDDPYQRVYTNRSLSIQKERNLNRNNLPRKPLSQFRNSRDISYQGSYDQNRGTKESLKNYQIIPPSDYSPQITPSSSAQNLSSLSYLRPEIPSKIPSASLQITGMQRNNIVLAARLELASRKNFELKKKYKHQVNAKNQKLMEEMRYRDYKNNMIKKLNFSDRVNEFFDQHPTKRDYDRSGIDSPAQLSRMITTDHQREEDAKILESLPKQEPRLFTEKLKEQELKFKEMIENKKKAGVVDPRDEQIKQQKESRDNLKLIHGLNLKPFDKNEYLDKKLFEDIKKSKRERARESIIQLANKSRFLQKTKDNLKGPEIKPFRKFKAVAKTIFGFIWLYKQTKLIRENLIKEQKVQKKPVYSVNSEVTKNWMIQSVLKNMIRYVVNNGSLSLNFLVKNLDSKTANKRISKCFSIIKFSIKQVIENCCSKSIPPSLLLFFQDNFRNGSLLLPEHVEQFEVERIDTDENGVMYKVTQEVKDFMRLYFLFGKIFIQVLTQPKSLGVKISTSARRNFKIICSVLFHILCQYFRRILPSKEYESDPLYAEENEESYAKADEKRIFTIKEIKEAFSHTKEVTEVEGYFIKCAKKIQ
ncbi:unnamed protein product [Moneuplotes crassus]|uniref:Uncharacterized protein n=1 Tax=Euplotes crassus TaxID=5936 RepID=A0AAD1Y6H2_EUPCR|nr:unnamed protein product [Moneuplotes crassus]